MKIWLQAWTSHSGSCSPRCHHMIWGAPKKLLTEVDNYTNHFLRSRKKGKTHSIKVSFFWHEINVFLNPKKLSFLQLFIDLRLSKLLVKVKLECCRRFDLLLINIIKNFENSSSPCPDGPCRSLITQVLLKVQFLMFDNICCDKTRQNQTCLTDTKRGRSRFCPHLVQITPNSSTVQIN